MGLFPFFPLLSSHSACGECFIFIRTVENKERRSFKMKLQNKQRLLSVIFTVIAVFSVISVTACGQKTENTPTSSAATKDEGLWADAVYTEDKTFFVDF